MPSKPISIGSRNYLSKKAALQAVRDVRQPYIDLTHRSRLRVSDPAHHDFLADLLLLHSESREKIGDGIDHFLVGPDEAFGTDFCFYLCRTDGTSTDFSFRNCIEGANARADRLGALREAIKAQTIEFRRIAFSDRRTVACEVLGSETTLRDAHVDHAPPATFHTLVESWLTERGLGLMDIEITPPADNQFVTTMANVAQETDWAAFHKLRARLRILSAKANLSITRRSHR